MSNELMNDILSAWTVVSAVLFAGIALWAFSGRRREEFDAAARLPLEDNDELDVRRD